jgi:hypothetical protein
LTWCCVSGLNLSKPGVDEVNFPDVAEGGTLPALFVNPVSERAFVNPPPAGCPEVATPNGPLSVWGETLSKAGFSRLFDSITRAVGSKATVQEATTTSLFTQFGRPLFVGQRGILIARLPRTTKGSHGLPGVYFFLGLCFHSMYY